MVRIENDEFRIRVLSFLKKQNFMHHINFELNVIEEGYTEGFLNISDIHLQQFGRVHGGVITTLADITAGFAAYTKVNKESHVVTGEIKVSFFSAAHGPVLKAVGKVLKAGRKVVFCESEIYDVIEGKPLKLVAKASTSMIVIPENQT